MISGKAIVTIAILLSSIAMFAGLQTQSAIADKTIVNQCKIDKDTGKCEFDQTYKSKRGDIKVKNEIDATNILQTGGGGGGNVSNVDQQARDRISTLETDNAALKTSNESAFKEIKILQDRVGQQADVLNTLVANNATVFSMLDQAITDIEGNQSTGGGGVPPINNTGGNESGGVVTNETGGGTGGNESGGVVTNETGGSTGNATGNVTNSTGGTPNGTGGFVPTFGSNPFANYYVPVHTRGR